MNSLIECCIAMKHISLAFSRLEEVLSYYDCQWYCYHEVKGSHRRFVRNHRVISIECYEPEVRVREMLRYLKQINNIHIETWFDLDKNTMIYANNYYRRNQLHKSMIFTNL